MSDSRGVGRGRTLGLVFSRHRALQLDGTLRSFLRHCTDAHSIDLKVLFRNSAEVHERQYRALAGEYRRVGFVREENFRAQVLDLIASYDSVLFLVDDNLFVRDFALATAERALREHPRALGFSLRLGQNTRYCYPYDAPQALPAFEELGPELLRYAWPGAAYDFGYPLEVSSSLYRVSEVLPFLRMLAFANPNTMEAEMANHVGVFAESHPDLLCFPLSVTFCNPLNLVQSVCKNRAVALPAYASQVLAGRVQRSDRIEVERLDDYVPDGCHNEVPLTLVPRRRRDDEETRMTFSIVVPCFNQGRYLTDCLESLAFQSVLPTEVIVVNDGSTDAETNALCARLGQYRYPFPVRSLFKPNGGLASARNHGIQAASGAIIVSLDSDDKLLPHALEAYRDFLTANPEIDICSSDIHYFGNKSGQHAIPHFNRWRLSDNNIMIYASAVIRRVFDAGYWYDERMRRGYEDWEFWIRTCGLGPFRSAPLKQAVFGYRQWGFSMISATNHQALMDQMRALHTVSGLLSPLVERRLRKREAPTHRLVVARSDWDQDTCDDLRWLAKAELEQFLKTDYLSRFLWFGEIASERVANLQLILNATSKRHRAPAYVFFDQDECEPYLVALDRLAAVQGWRAELDSDQPFDRVVGIGTRGDRYPRVASVVEHGNFAPFLSGVLAPLRGLDHPRLLPEGWGRDCRVDNDLWYYFHREPAVPHVDPGVEHARTLLIAMPYLTYGGADFAVRTLLEEGSLRRRFDRIFIVTFEEDENAAHALFEPLADAIYHLSRLGLDDEQKRACALALIQAAGVSDFFILNSRHGYDLIPRIRKAKLPARISAEIYSMGWDEATGLSDEAYFRMVAQHAVLIDRLACNSDQHNSYMINHLYFPRSKIRAIKLGVDQGRFCPGDGDRSARPKQVVWCGRLCFEKDPLLGLQVAERFQRERPDVKFLFIGNGPYRLEFVARLHALQAAGNLIEWLPSTDQMPRIFQESDCFFMTSVYEGVPITVMEAASTGLPVVMSFKHTSVGELVEHGQFVEVANRQDVDEYCRRLHEALAAPPRAPSPFFSHHRYVQEIIDWLFSDDEPALACLDAVFGINHAA